MFLYTAFTSVTRLEINTSNLLADVPRVRSLVVLWFNFQSVTVVFIIIPVL